MTEVYAGLPAPDSINPDLEAVNQDARDLGSRVFSPHASACGCGVCGFRGPVSEAAVSPGASFSRDTRKTIDEAATQLTRESTGWGITGQSITVNYAFRATWPDKIPDTKTDAGGFSRFTADQIRQTDLALQAWADVSGIRFTRVGSGVDGEGAFSDSATILFGNYSTGETEFSGFAFLPGSRSSGINGDIWINISKSFNSELSIYGSGFQTLVHEIGHAIGLSHPGDYNAGLDKTITYSNNAGYTEDTLQYTVMSYFSEQFTGGNFFSRYPSAPLLHDIAAVQKLYGPNMTTRTGDTVYGFNSNADRPWFQATTSSPVMIWAVWDAGGSDTFNFSGYTSSQKIDLRQGSFSDIGGLVGNVSIARGVDIENAIGGTGNDTILGNNLNNRLEGRAGSDTLQGGEGADTLIGGAGNDRYLISDTNDLITEAASEGTDTVDIAIAVAGGTYTLGANIEGAIVTSTVAYNVIGNSLSNFLYGNAVSNRIEGGSGNDTLWDGGGGGDSLIGGVGDDLFFIDSPSTLVMESALEGQDSVVVRFGSSTGAWTLSSNIETASIQASSGGSLIGNSLSNRLEGGAGNDTLQGGAGADTLVGGAGDDHYILNDQDDLVSESASSGLDTVEIAVAAAGGTYTLGGNLEIAVVTSSVAFNLVGNSLNNVLLGNSARNRLEGGAGGDVLLDGGGGGDTLIGGTGDDVFFIETPTTLIVENFGEGTDTVYLNFGADLGSWALPSGIEEASLLYATSAGNVSGNSLNNQLEGGARGDTLFGGDGADTLFDASGTNFLRGEAGDDSLSGGSGFDDMHGNMGNDSLRGGEGNDWVVGGKDNDLLFGDAGFDIVYGNMGNDTVDGGAGNDWVRGGQGDDTVMGGSGDDWIWGDRGNDTISGGAGADLFHAASGAGIDRITDFSFAAGDRLKLEGSPSRTVSQSGADVVVDMGNGDQVILVGVSLSSLGTGWLI